MPKTNKGIALVSSGVKEIKLVTSKITDFKMPFFGITDFFLLILRYREEEIKKRAAEKEMKRLRGKLAAFIRKFPGLQGLQKGRLRTVIFKSKAVYEYNGEVLRQALGEDAFKENFREVFILEVKMTDQQKRQNLTALLKDFFGDEHEALVQEKIITEPINEDEFLERAAKLNLPEAAIKQTKEATWSVKTTKIKT